MSNFVNHLLVAITFFQLLFYHVVTTFVKLLTPRALRKKKIIKGQNVLITGAGSGIGRELAIEFSKHGVCLILVDINKQSLFHTEKMLAGKSPVFIYECDVSDYKEVYEMGKKVKKEVGNVDILVNNAGIVSGHYFMDLPEDKIVKTMEVNALAHFWTCKAFLPAMIDKNSGHIVNVISIAGMSGFPRLTDYCASKFAAVGFSESLEVELRARNIDGIKITMVCPSLIDTGLFQGCKTNLGAVLTPSYVAQEIVAGVLEDEETVFLPNFFKYLMMFKFCLPRWLITMLHQKSGNIKCMEDFTGRAQIENGNEKTSKSSKTG